MGNSWEVCYNGPGKCFLNATFFENLYHSGTKPVVLSGILKYSDKYVPKSSLVLYFNYKEVIDRFITSQFPRHFSCFIYS